jgi:enamine deaminase RidA (YjgF/YER057c/UK114 family)
MHPVLARYLDPSCALTVLTRSARGENVAEEDRHLAAAAADFPDERDLLLSSGPHLDDDVQRVVLFLATHAAVRALEEDPQVGPVAAQARQALVERGARPAEATALIAEVVAEEAFATEDAPDTFDRAWVLEALALLPRLASLDEASVNAQIADFARTGSEGTPLLRERAARALLEEAWEDGASPINVEHVDEALDELYAEAGEGGFPEAAAALRGFVGHLEASGLAGPLRAARLRKAVDRAALAGAAADEDGDEAGED